MSGNKCNYVCCGNSKRTHPDITFFRFPKDTVLARKWVLHSGNDDLLKIDENSLWRRFLCEKHFTDDVYFSGNRLRLLRKAVPVPYNTEYHDTGSLIYVPEEICRTVCSPSPEVYQPTRKKSQNQSSSLEKSPKISRHEFRQKVIYQRKLKLQRLKRNLQLNTESVINTFSFPSSASKTIVRMQLLHNRKRPWSFEEKKLALSIYCNSPETYKFLRRLKIVLPPVSSIHLWLEKATMKDREQQSVRSD